MTTHQVLVENIKCGGCANTIKTSLLKTIGVTAVQILKEEDKVCITGVGVGRQELVARLASLGYPEKGNNSLLSKAKSLVSCTMGRVL